MLLSPSKLCSWTPKVVEAEDDQDEIDGLGHMTDKPLKNGRKYVDSKFVHDLMDNKTDQHYFLRGHIWPSMRNDLPTTQRVDRSFCHQWGSYSCIMSAI